MPYANNGDVRIYWDEKGAGTPLLLVMGAAYSSRMWYPVIDSLATTHRVIWFDNRGIGNSQVTRKGSIADMAADAVAVLDAAGVAKAHIYGASLGGVVVLQVALQSPDRVRSLILGCTGILSDDKPRSPRWTNLVAYVPPSVRRRMLSRSKYGSAATEENAARDRAMLLADRATTAGLLQQQNALRAYSVDKSAIAGLGFPALVLHGTEDPAVPIDYGKELAETLSDSRFVPFEGAGHNYLVVDPQRANQLVTDFLAEVDQEPASDDVVSA